jgi:hypothetical protein
MTKNKGVTIVLAVVITALGIALVAGPTIWSMILRAHGF